MTTKQKPSRISEVSEVMVSFRATATTRARLTEAAKRAGVSRSEFIRMAALAASRDHAGEGTGQ